ncbi:hypothetical protein PCANC_08556 [Puccinia coronata f. sp. avenae]|uniref:MULE transposase domain-containing protein n=1 Tax=Puccinia coronata f. sp. avenae TaxID=200324 RepID=A0A2N5V1W2_9BASI|nr:hypothetical protein PCANC_08556 [Puccinia coronata f. sp. avenae]
MHHYWCLFHVLKAFKGKAKTYLKDQWTEASEQFWTIMYSQEDPMPTLASFTLRWAQVSPGFSDYILHQWVGRIHKWAIFYRTNFCLQNEQTDHQGIHTNNYTESWHRLLKNSYLSHPDRLQIDEVVQILTEEVKSHYHWLQQQVKSGFAGQTSNKFQMRQKLVADAFTPEEMEISGVVCMAITGRYTIFSFSNPTVRQHMVKTSFSRATGKVQLASCTCQHFNRCGKPTLNK